MKNTIIGVIFLSVLGLNMSSVAATPKKTPGSTIVSAGQAELPNTNSLAVTATVPAAVAETGTVVQLTKAMFLENIYDYEKNPKQWIFKGDKPCIIDFYADWCRPCKMVAPIMAELSEKYKGQIIIYKVNTDQEKELSQFFGIRSIPTLLFCPAKGDPQMTQGALPKEDYEKIITNVLLQKK